MKKQEKHKWTTNDDLKILFVFKFGFEHSPYNKKELAQLIGVSEGSVNFRIGNFKAIEGIGKATHYAKMSKSVYDMYNQLNLDELKGVAFPT